MPSAWQDVTHAEWNEETVHLIKHMTLNQAIPVVNHTISMDNLNTESGDGRRKLQLLPQAVTLDIFILSWLWMEFKRRMMKCLQNLWRRKSSRYTLQWWTLQLTEGIPNGGAMLLCLSLRRKWGSPNYTVFAIFTSTKQTKTSFWSCCGLKDWSDTPDVTTFSMMHNGEAIPITERPMRSYKRRFSTNLPMCYSLN